MSQTNGDFNYEFTMGEIFSTGTYVVIIKQENGSDAAIFGVDKYTRENITPCARAYIKSRNSDPLSSFGDFICRSSGKSSRFIKLNLLLFSYLLCVKLIF